MGKTRLCPPPQFSTDRSRVVVLMWFIVACFGVEVTVVFHLMFFFHYTFSLGCVAEWPTFEL